MASSNVVKNFTDGTITLKDGTGTPISVTARFTEGDLAIDRLQEQLNEVVAYEARGVLTSVRHTSRFYPKITFSAQMSEFTSVTANNLADAILKNGAFAAALSTLGTAADVYTLTITISVEGSNFGDSADHTATFADCHCQIAFAEGDPNKWTISATCYGAITGDLAV
jgi:hypothetical protein